MAHKIIYCGLILSLLLLLVPQPVFAEDVRAIKAVHTEPSSIDISENEAACISVEIAHEGLLSACICTLVGKCVRCLKNEIEVKAGIHQITWDWLDDSGHTCAQGVYIPIVTIKNSDNREEIYNPTAFPWGHTVFEKDLYYDFERKAIHYRLDCPVLCRIRIGEWGGGPLYRTLCDWEPREAGIHDEPWDGMDTRGIITITSKKKHYIVLDCFSLPENSIIVKGSHTINQEFEEYAANKRDFTLYPPNGKNIHSHASHLRSSCHELDIVAKIIGPASFDNEVPFVEGMVEIIVDVAGHKDLIRNNKENLELYFFMDGQFVYEGSIDEFPENVTFDSRNYQNGEHVVTINAITLTDHIGAYSMKINIDNVNE
ncbi:MAG: hypothetical protein ACMUIP_02070 [bacterium]